MAATTGAVYEDGEVRKDSGDVLRIRELYGGIVGNRFFVVKNGTTKKRLLWGQAACLA